MSKFRGFRQASSNILKAFGGAITYQQIESGTYRTATGTVSELVTEHAIVGFFENVKRSNQILIIFSGKLQLKQYQQVFFQKDDTFFCDFLKKLYLPFGIINCNLSQ